jgi:hypothetical protein
MNTRTVPALMRLAVSATLLVAMPAPAVASDTAHVPLPGASGPPWVETGKVNVFRIDELPPAMRAETRRATQRAAERARAGLEYDEIDEDDWQWPDPVESLYADFASMNQGRVLIHPRDIGHTELATYRFLGLPDNTANPGEPVTTIARQFQRPDGVIVELREDELAGHGAVVMVRELIHDRVGPWPAVFSVERAPSGRLRSVIDWADNGTDFTLMVLDDVRRPSGQAAYDKAWMFRLAQSIEDAPRAKTPGGPYVRAAPP